MELKLDPKEEKNDRFILSFYPIDENEKPIILKRVDVVCYEKETNSLNLISLKTGLVNEYKLDKFRKLVISPEAFVEGLDDLKRISKLISPYS